MTKIKDMELGSVVKFGDFHGETPMFWIKTAQDHQTYPDNSSTIYHKDIYAIRYFDAAEPENPNSEIKIHGCNNWKLSNLRQWSNSDGDQGEWFTPQYVYDTAPIGIEKDGIVFSNYNDDSGFLTNFSEDELNLILDTTHYYHGPDGIQLSDTDKFFLPTSVEIGLRDSSWEESVIGDGFNWNYFTDNESRYCYPTEDVVESTDGVTSVVASDKPLYYPLCDTPGDKSQVCSCDAGNLAGQLSTRYCNVAFLGMRLACNIDGDAEFELDEYDGVYYPVFEEPNDAPTVTMSASDLGDIKETPIISFNIYDVDDNTLTVNAFMDETKVIDNESYEIPDGSRTITYTPDWDSLEYGFHRFEVHVTDSAGEEAVGQTSFTKVVEDSLVTANGAKAMFEEYHRFVTQELDLGISNYESIDAALEDNPNPEDGTVILVNGEWYVAQDGTYVQQSAKVWYDERTPGQLYKSDEAPESLDIGKFDGCFYATRVYNAVWNDYAELMEAGEDIEAGHVAYIHEDGLVYATGRPGQAIGIVSDCYGHLLGGNGDPDEDGFVAVSLAGRVPLEVRGEFQVGDYVYASHDGVGIRNTFGLPGCLGRCVGKDPKDREGYINVLVGGM